MKAREEDCLHCLTVDVHLSEHLYQAWLHEAERRGATVQTLVGGLLDEMEEDLESHPILLS